MTWCFEFIQALKAVVVMQLLQGNVSEKVVAVRSGRKKSLVMISYAGGAEEEKDLKDFRPRNKFSEHFIDVLDSRSKFMRKFEEKEKEEQMTDDVDLELSSNSCAEDVTTSPQEQCVKVHYKNLLEAPENRRVRPLNREHVRQLTKSFRGDSKQEKLLACELKTGTVDNLKVAGEATCYVIGGNHTRAAITSLIESGEWPSNYLNCRVYTKLDEVEALRVGVKHNLIDCHSLEMTFMEKTKILRQLKTMGKKWSKSAMRIFGYQSISETRNKLRTMAAVADLEESVWDRIVELSEKATKPVKQTAFTSFVHQDNQTQKELLTIWEESGFSSYYREMRRKGATKEQVEDQEEKAAEGSSINSSNEACSTDYKRELKIMTDQYNQMKNLVNTKESEIELLKQEIELMKTEAERGCDRCESLKRKADVLTDETEIHKNNECYSTGDRVWAYYAPLSTYYPARILEVKNDSYRVEYCEDGIISTVGNTQLKRPRKGDFKKFPTW